MALKRLTLDTLSGQITKAKKTDEQPHAFGVGSLCTWV